LKKAGWKTTILWECEIDLIDTLPKIKRIIQESVDHKTNHP
jgi:G:T-mismatch repair DNA endonuclease (very short patch repair protein)